MSSTPTMHLIAGVNGSGKTTFYRYWLEAMTPGAEFVNADEFARSRWPGSEAVHSAEAARWATGRRIRLMESRLTFVTETVFSHPSKLELVRGAKRRGYRVILHHIGLEGSELASARVATRVEAGGHDVPGATVTARYERTQALIPQAARIADIAMVFDNSGRPGTPTHRFILRIQGGRLRSLTRDAIPRWVVSAYRSFLPDEVWDR